MSDSLKLYKSNLTKTIQNQCFMIKQLLSPSHLLTVVISVGNPNIIITCHQNISIALVQKRTELVWSMRFFFSMENPKNKMYWVYQWFIVDNKSIHMVSVARNVMMAEIFLKGKMWKSKCHYWQSQQSPERCVSMFLSYKCLCMSVFAFELLLFECLRDENLHGLIVISYHRITE